MKSIIKNAITNNNPKASILTPKDHSSNVIGSKPKIRIANIPPIFILLNSFKDFNYFDIIRFAASFPNWHSKNSLHPSLSKNRQFSP